MQAHDAPGPLAAYRALADDSVEGITFDAEQERAATCFQLLHDRLVAGLTNPPKRGFRIFGRSFRSERFGSRGIYIHGGVGRGKSMLMDIFFNSIPVAAKRRIHHHHFMQEVHAEINRGLVSGVATGGDSGLVRFARNLSSDMHLLCFDDLNVTDIGDAMILGPLFEALIDAGVIVVITSNRAPDALYEDGINRARFEPFIDLVKARLEIIKLDGPTDYRTLFMSRSQLYHTPLSPEVSDVLEEIFRHLRAGAPPVPAIFEIQGRTLTLSRTARGVAMTTFDDLCTKALGAADYIAIQAAFHTLILCDIPRMGPELLNEAKRFITLIDVLYEHRVNLVCSAAAEPDALYTKGNSSFEFARTVSRLHEMQGLKYIAQTHRE